VNLLYRSDAEYPERIREVILYDYVSDDFSTNNMTQSDEDYVEAREGTRRAQKTLRRRMMIAGMKWTLLTTVFIRKPIWGKVKCSTHIRRRWQNILTKLPGLLTKQGKPFCHSKHETVSLQTTFFITFFNQNQYFLIIRSNFSRESDAKLTDKIDTKAFTSLLCIAGALRSNKQSLEELWVTGRDGPEKFRLLMTDASSS
jgi:hypothetical protein